MMGKRSSWLSSLHRARDERCPRLDGVRIRGQQGYVGTRISRWQRPHSWRHNIRGTSTGASADLSISTTERRRVTLDTQRAPNSRRGTAPPSPVQPSRWLRRPRQCLLRGQTLTSSSSSFPLLPWTYRTTPRALQVLCSRSAREHKIRNRVTCSNTADFTGPVFPGDYVFD